MRYITHPDFIPSVYNLYKKNGHYKNIAQRVLGEWAKTQNEANQFFIDKDIFTLPLTHYGENRIPHCLKYNLSNNCRLITILHQDTRIFLFSGTHDACDKWLDKNQSHDFFTTIQKETLAIIREPKITHEPNIISKLKTEKNINTQVMQLRHEIKAIRQEITEWSNLIAYPYSTSNTINIYDLEHEKINFLKQDTQFFLKKINKISNSIKKNNTSIALHELNNTEYFTEIFFLKISHIDKLKQLINLTKH